jgi:hypothetical protein
MDVYLFNFVPIGMFLFLWLTSKEGANCFEHLCNFNGVESLVFIPFLDSLLIICYFVFIGLLIHVLVSYKRSSDLAKPKGPVASNTSLAWSATHCKGVTKV